MHPGRHWNRRPIGLVIAEMLENHTAVNQAPTQRLNIITKCMNIQF